RLIDRLALGGGLADRPEGKRPAAMLEQRGHYDRQRDEAEKRNGDHVYSTHMPSLPAISPGRAAGQNSGPDQVGDGPRPRPGCSPNSYFSIAWSGEPGLTRRINDKDG